jgi:hypothetical protein
MIPNFKEILSELSYRVDGGIPDLTKKSHVNHLIDILRENGISDAEHLAQKTRVYFSYLNEADSKRVKPPQGKTWVKNKKSGAIYAVGTVDTKVHDIPSDDEISTAKKSGSLSKEEPPTQGKKLSGSDFELDIEKKPSKKEPTPSKEVDVNKGVVVVAPKQKYGTKGSKEVDQNKANNRLKALPPSGISTEKAISNFKKTYPQSITTKYEFPQDSDALLKSKLPPAGYDALKSILKMSKQGDFEPPISMITDQYGAGKISAQANELALQAVFSFPNSPKGMVARNNFINSMVQNADAIEKAGGIPILDKTWIKEFSGAHDAFINNMNRTHGTNNWEVTGMTWDVRAQQESLGIDYNSKGDSTDMNAQIKVGGKVYNEEISCKKNWQIFLLNAGLGEAKNWFYTMGAEKENRANDLQNMKDAKDPRFGKAEDAELREYSKVSLAKAPIKNKELQDAQLESAKKGFELIREIPNKDVKKVIDDCTNRKKNDPFYMDKNEAELAKRIQKYLNSVKQMDMGDFAKNIGGGAKDFKKAVMVYHKMLGVYSGKSDWLNSHKQITYGFMQEAAKKMATNKEFQGMLLRKLQEAIPVKTMVEGVETMQIDSMYVTQKHMQEMFGTDKWDNIKEFLSIKVTNGVASLSYSAKGNNAKPLKIANIQMREKGVGYNGSVSLECLPSKEFEVACKDIDKKINKG